MAIASVMIPESRRTARRPAISFPRAVEGSKIAPAPFDLATSAKALAIAELGWLLISLDSRRVMAKAPNLFNVGVAASNSCEVPAITACALPNDRASVNSSPAVFAGAPLVWSINTNISLIRSTSSLQENQQVRCLRFLHRQL